MCRRNGIRIGIQPAKQFGTAGVHLATVEGKSLAHLILYISKEALGLIKAFEIEQRPQVFLFECPQTVGVLLALVYLLKEQKLNHLFQRLVDAEFRMRQIEDAMHLVTMMNMIVYHVRKVNAHLGIALLHSQIKGVDKHLVTQSACHFYQSHNCLLLLYMYNWFCLPYYLFIIPRRSCSPSQ